MKKINIILLLTMSSLFVNAQINLVPNPSFEDTVACPDHGGNIDQASGWINCGITPDYYNACANNSFPSLGVPDGLYSGFQHAFDGNAYAAFATYSFPIVQREFIGVQLIQPLMIGSKYFVSCYISMADYFLCSCNNFGFRFFNSMPFNNFNPAPIDNFSHFHSNVIISDSINWMKIVGYFIADSSYQYLIIGNFYDNFNTSIINCDTLASDQTYYLVDAVCVSTDSLVCNIWTGINEIDKYDISVFPSLVDGYLQIKGLSEDEQYYIFNVMGMIIKKGKTSRQIIEINLKSFSDGLYFVSIKNRTFKFLIIH